VSRWSLAKKRGQELDKIANKVVLKAQFAEDIVWVVATSPEEAIAHLLNGGTAYASKDLALKVTGRESVGVKLVAGEES
jgi:hypothetical protein